jgi:hypothetical protein
MISSLAQAGAAATRAIAGGVGTPLAGAAPPIMIAEKAVDFLRAAEAGSPFGGQGLPGARGG